MSELRTLALIRTPPKKKTLRWLITTPEGEVFSAEGTAVAISDENTSVGIYDGNDLILHRHDVLSVVLQDEERVKEVTPKKTSTKRATTKRKVKQNGG